MLRLKTNRTVTESVSNLKQNVRLTLADNETCCFEDDGFWDEVNEEHWNECTD